MQRNESKITATEKPLTLADKRNKCVMLLKSYMESLNREIPGLFGEVNILTSCKIEDASSQLVPVKDPASGIAIIFWQRRGEKEKRVFDEVLAPFFKAAGFTLVHGESNFRAKNFSFGEIGFYCPNSDSEINTLLKKLQFDVGTLKTITSSVLQSPTGGHRLFVTKAVSESSALADIRISELTAQIFEGLPVRSVTINDDVITFKGEKEIVEKIFSKALDIASANKLSLDAIMKNIVLTYGKPAGADKILTEIESIKPIPAKENAILIPWMYEEPQRGLLSLEKFLRFIELKNKELYQITVNIGRLLEAMPSLKTSPKPYIDPVD
ncbi:MAG: hypothetical protein ACYCQI_02105 [Gammaproteobacteria bacterium]